MIRLAARLFGRPLIDVKIGFDDDAPAGSPVDPLRALLASGAVQALPGPCGDPDCDVCPDLTDPTAGGRGRPDNVIPFPIGFPLPSKRGGEDPDGGGPA